MLRNFFDSLRIRLILVATSLGYFSLSGYLMVREQGVNLFVLTILVCALAYAGIAFLTLKGRLAVGNWSTLVVTLIGGIGIVAGLHLEYIINNEWYFFHLAKLFSITFSFLLILVSIWLPWLIRVLRWKIRYLWVCIFCFFLALIFVSAISSHEFDPKAKFVGDIKSYQSLAVNWAKGHGLRYGGIEDVEVYQFQRLSEDDYIRFKKNGEREGYLASTDFFRAPGYPIFLGVVYKIVGVSPLAAKRVQYLLIAISCALLPLIGFHYWRSIGFLSGIVSAVVAFEYYAEGVSLADQLMSEALITFSLVVLICLLIVWEKYSGLWTSFFLGLMLGACLLIKTSLIFLPVLFIAYCGWNMRRRNVRRWGRFTVSIIGGFLLVTGVWSAHVSVHAGKPVFISIQAGTTLKAGNNELSFDGTGADDDSWQNNKSSFYYRSEIEQWPEPVQVVLFWKEHWDKLPGLAHKKIGQAFNSPALHVTLLFFILECVFSLTKFIRNRIRQSLRVLAVIGIACSTIFVGPLNAGPLYIYFGVLIYSIRLVSGSSGRYLLPVPLVLIFLNFLFITIAVFGHFRYLVVMEWVFVLTAISYCGTSAVVAFQYLDEQQPSSDNKRSMAMRAVG